MTDAEIIWLEKIAERDRALDSCVSVDPSCKAVREHDQYSHEMQRKHGEFLPDTKDWWDRRHVLQCVRCARHTDLHRRGDPCNMCG